MSGECNICGEYGHGEITCGLRQLLQWCQQYRKSIEGPLELLDPESYDWAHADGACDALDEVIGCIETMLTQTSEDTK